MTIPSFSLFALPDFPLVHNGDDVAEHIVACLDKAGDVLQTGDIVVVAQKIISKAEGRVVRLDDIQPNSEAESLAVRVDKDPRVVQAILDDSRSIVRARPGLLIAEQSSGWICANAGVDRSNVTAHTGEPETVALLPADADASAADLRMRLGERTGVLPAVLINDSHGRPWRIGTVGVCIGCAGLPPIWDQRGQHDLFGYELHASEECIADELAAAATLLMGQSDEGRPVVIVRGYQMPDRPSAPARSIQRPAHMDAFR